MVAKGRSAVGLLTDVKGRPTGGTGGCEVVVSSRVNIFCQALGAVDVTWTRFQWRVCYKWSKCSPQGIDTGSLKLDRQILHSPAAAILEKSEKREELKGVDLNFR